MKSVKPEATARRSFVETYGLTTDDLVFVKSLSPGLVVPIRSFAAEIRNWNGENSFAGNWIASTAELGEWYRSVGAIREGRFLCDIDSAEHANVAVLGSNVANKLFPLGNALGQTIRLGGKARVWTVVGVMREQQGELASFNDAVIVHLAANRALHGDTVMVRSSGTRGMEAVQFSHILVQPGAGQSLKGMVQLLQARLETAHQRKDWEVVSSGVR